jgi:hypothetical protein
MPIEDMSSATVTTGRPGRRGERRRRDFKPDERLIELMSRASKPAAARPTRPRRRRGELLGQLKRLQDLYVLGDLPKAQYVMLRQAIEEELQRLGAPAEAERRSRQGAAWRLFQHPGAGDRARRAAPASRLAVRAGLGAGGRIVAVRPHEDFLPYFQAASRCRKQGKGRGAESGSDGGQSRVCCLAD